MTMQWIDSINATVPIIKFIPELYSGCVRSHCGLQRVYAGTIDLYPILTTCAARVTGSSERLMCIIISTAQV